MARYGAGLVRRFGEGSLPAVVEVNGAPAVTLAAGGRLVAVLVVHTDGERLTARDLVVNRRTSPSPSASCHRSRACLVSWVRKGEHP
ncbi:MAG TPA: hypothetical protein VGO95_03400 [Modestobacter sp.]|nr:hypothetical protein [Modestobacter sp.]